MPPPDIASLGPQPGLGSSPMTRPSAMLGNAANGVAMVGQAVDMLEKALPEIPPQHPLHKKVLSAISSLSKEAPPAAQSPGVGLQALKQLLAAKTQGNPLAALLGGRGGGAAGMPGVQPPPGAGAAGPPGGPPPLGGPPPGGAGAPP